MARTFRLFGLGSDLRKPGRRSGRMVPSADGLESRRLLAASVSVSGTTLVINGIGNADHNIQVFNAG